MNIFGKPVVIDAPCTWVQIIVQANLASSNREARHLINQKAFRFGNLPTPIREWEIITDSECTELGTFLVSRGKKWSMGHIREIIIKEAPVL